MTRDEIAAQLSEENPEALLADGFEDAFVGISRRCGQPTLAVYDYKRAVEVLMQRDGMTTEEAEEWMEFNVVGAWAGEHTPVWFVRVRR
jgi:hypothetical protein